MTIRPDQSLPNDSLNGRRNPQAVAAALRAADIACRSRGVQFTAIRRSVLESLWEKSRPVGAYDLIRLLETKLGRAVTPPRRSIARSISCWTRGLSCASPRRMPSCPASNPISLMPASS